MSARAYRALTAAVAVSLLSATWPIVASGAPSTPEIDAKQAEYDTILAELDRLTDDLSMQVEEYNAVSEALGRTREEIADAEIGLAAAEDEVARAEDLLSDRAESLYKDGPTGVLEILLGTATFRDLLVRLDFLRRVNAQDAALVADVRVSRDLADELSRTLEQREIEQSALRDEAASGRLEIERSIERRKAYASSLSLEVRELIAEEEERQRKLEEERARAAAEAAAAEAGAASAGRVDGPSTFPDADPTAGAGRPEVVEIALRYLGVPYVWGGSDPEIGFDCSGLTQYVYRQVGVDLPRTSRSQSRAGLHVAADALDQLVLGDLVFFGYDADPDRVHHVGIYVGDGNYLHAPQTGEVVKISSLADRIARKGDYVGASRF